MAMVQSHRVTKRRSFVKVGQWCILIGLIIVSCFSYYLNPVDTHLQSVFPREINPQTTYFELDEIKASLRPSSQNRESLGVNLKVLIELKSVKEVAILELIKPWIIEKTAWLIGDMVLEDFAANNGGVERLKESLVTKINAAIAPLKINNLFLKDMVVQQM